MQPHHRRADATPTSRIPRSEVGDLASRRSESTSDGELVRRARAGDDWAREALFRRYIAKLTGLITHIVSKAHEADDVVQDAFAEALRDLDHLRDPDAFRSWLFRIAINRAKKSLRRRKLARFLGLDRSPPDATFAELAAPGLSPEAISELRLVDDALARLPVHERSAWILRHAHEEKIEDVAAILGCSLATAKRRIAAAELSVQAWVEGRSP